jgi:hypothetical protein
MKQRLLIVVGLIVVLASYFLPIMGNDSLFKLILQGPNDTLPGLIWIFWILVLAMILLTGILLYLKKMGGFLPVGAGLFTILILLYNFMGAISPVQAVGFNILGAVGIAFWLIFVACILLITGGALVLKEA